MGDLIIEILWRVALFCFLVWWIIEEVIYIL